MIWVGPNSMCVMSLEEEEEIRAQMHTEKKPCEDGEKVIIFKAMREAWEEINPVNTLILDFQSPKP